MPEKLALHAIVHGRVQGVSFRAFVYQRAIELKLTGFSRNLPSGDEVEVYAEGDKSSLEKLLEFLKVGPSQARVTGVTLDWPPYSARFHSFEIQV